MKRLHLFEFNDLSWFPDVWRNMLTDYLNFIEIKFEMFKYIVPKFREIIDKSPNKNIIDLCSGAVGPIVETKKWLEKDSTDTIKITLTDLYPNVGKFESACQESKNINFLQTPVNATNVPMELKGIRTLFNAFHHFAPKDARNILADAANKREGIAIFEATERSLGGVLGMFFAPLIVLLTTPFIKPFKLSRLFWTYIIPVIPLTVLWDGLVSALRTYSTAELQQMTAEIAAQNYVWEIGQINVKGVGNITFLLGYPKK